MGSSVACAFSELNRLFKLSRPTMPVALRIPTMVMVIRMSIAKRKSRLGMRLACFVGEGACPDWPDSPDSVGASLVCLGAYRSAFPFLGVCEAGSCSTGKGISSGVVWTSACAVSGLAVGKTFRPAGGWA